MMPRFPRFASAGQKRVHLHSPYGTVIVRENKLFRWMYFGGEGIQSAQYKADPNACVFGYLRAMLLFIHFYPNAENVLILGLGGGGLARALLATHPDLTVTGVELNPTVMALAKSQFGLPETPHLQLHTQHAMEFLRTTTAYYDTIFIDIFLTDDMPALYHRQAFYRLCFQRLNAQGCVAINLIRERSTQLIPVMQHLSAIFNSQTLMILLPGHQNVVLFAFKGTFDRQIVYRLVKEGVFKSIHHTPALGLQATFCV